MVQKGALFWQVAGLLLVGLIILQILGTVADIPVTADDHVLIGVFCQHGIEFIQEAVLFIQLRRIGIAGRQIQRGHADIAGGGGNPAAGIGEGAETDFDIGKRRAGKDADPGAALGGGIGKL